MTWARKIAPVVTAVAVGGVFLTVSCTQDAVSPATRPRPDERPSRDWNGPNTVSAQLTPDPLYGSGATTAPLGEYPTQTVVTVIANGYVVLHDNYDPNVQDLNLAPGGDRWDTPMVAVIKGFANGTTSAFAFPYNNRQSADTITMLMDPGTSIQKVTRNPSSGLSHWPWYINGHYVWCSPSTSPPCYTFSGGHAIQIIPPEASYSASADSALYSIGSTAAIIMARSPLTINGISTPMQVDSAMWTAAPDSLGGDAADTVPLNACTNYRWVGTDRVCDHVVKGAGKLKMIGHANGFRVAPEVTISVRDARLSLTASSSAVGPGDTVVFTPRWSDGYQIVVNSWKWQPDTLPSLIGQDGGDCTSAQPVCTKPIRQTGWMFVTVTRDGRLRTAKARVTMIPCPTNDPVLNNPGVRAAFKDLIVRSGYNLPPGDGIPNGGTRGNKLELSGYLFRRPDGTIYFAEDTAADRSATECTSTPSDPYGLRRDTADIVIGNAHTHPTRFHQAVYGCRPDAQGRQRKRGPWDTNSGRWDAVRGVDSTNGGGSGADWDTADALGVNEYVINANGEVWALPPGLDPALRPTNRRKTLWMGNSNSACDW